MSEQVDAMKKDMPFFFADDKDNGDKRTNDSGDERDDSGGHDHGDHDDCNSDDDFYGPPETQQQQPTYQSAGPRRGGGNTGVKGVLADFAEHSERKRAEFESQKIRNRQMLEKMCVTVKDKDAPQDKPEEDEEDPDLKRIREQRLAEFMKKQTSSQQAPQQRTRVYGYLKQITQEEYIHEIDNEPPNMAIEHRNIKFLKILSTDAKADYHDEALPSLLVYIGGKLLVSFIPVTQELERDFVKEDLELLLAR
eukprot:gene20361-24429_t